MRRRTLKRFVPQYEFAFAAETFNLEQESALDGERIARERAELEQAKAEADAAQARLFPAKAVRNRKTRKV